MKKKGNSIKNWNKRQKKIIEILNIHKEQYKGVNRSEGLSAGYYILTYNITFRAIEEKDRCKR